MKIEFYGDLQYAPKMTDGCFGGIVSFRSMVIGPIDEVVIGMRELDKYHFQLQKLYKVTVEEYNHTTGNISRARDAGKEGG